uniref:Uncharacterized protein n=1 Tax=Romanomermis culicivorax TaxID=13658 RepID=A0A915I6R3_ROMCU
MNQIAHPTPPIHGKLIFEPIQTTSVASAIGAQRGTNYARGAQNHFYEEYLRRQSKPSIPSTLGTTYSLQCRTGSIRHNANRLIGR